PACARPGWSNPSPNGSRSTCTPARSNARWPAGGSSPKAADPATHDPGDQEAPALSLRPSPGHAAADPGGPPCAPDAGQDAAPAGLDARYEHLRHAVLHDRARAFPLGLAVLIGKGVAACQRLAT